MSIVVITLAKNDLEGLQRTARSIVKQSLKVNWRIITPDDSSSTHQYAQELLQHGTVERIVLDEGLGIYHAMNLGIFGAEADEWIWFLNSGDEFAAFDSYELVTKTISLSNNRWIFGGHFLGSSAGGILGEMPPPATFRPEKQLFAKSHISHQSTVFEAKFLQELGGFDESFKMAADWDLMVRASKQYPGFRIAAPLSIFYMGGISTKSRAIGNRELLSLRRSHLPEKYRVKSYLWFSYRTVRNFIVQSIENTFPNLADKVRKSRIKVKHTLKSHQR